MTPDSIQSHVEHHEQVDRMQARLRRGEHAPDSLNLEVYEDRGELPCGDCRGTCACCPQFTCACCGLTFCLQHIGREEDPDCTCAQTDVDEFDARSCDAHRKNPRPVLLCRVCAAPEETAGMEPVTQYGQITEAA